MPDINAPDIGRRVRRRYSMKGDSGIATLSPELVGVVLLDDLTGPEDQDVAIIRPAIGETQQAAVGGEQGHCQLLNPADSGTFVQVEAVLVILATAGTIIIGEHATALTSNGTNKVFRDQRVAGTPLAETRLQTNAGGLTDQDFARLALPAANESILIPLDLFIGAGQGLTIRAITVNVLLATTWFWTERPDLPGS